MSVLDCTIVVTLGAWLLASIRVQFAQSAGNSLLSKLVRSLVLVPWRLFGPEPTSFDCCLQYRWQTGADDWSDWQLAYGMPRPTLLRAFWNPESRIKSYVHTASLRFVFAHLQAGRPEDPGRREVAAYALRSFVSTAVPEVYEHSWQFRVTSYHGRVHRNKLAVAYTSPVLPSIAEATP